MYLFSLSLFFHAGCEEEESVIVPETGTMTDIDNNVYRTIKIGGKWWMAEDLKVTRYKNGMSINYIVAADTAQWASSQTGAYCIYQDLQSASGLLYNWYAVNDQNGLAPEGWHIATDEEWKQLEQSAGMSFSEVSKTGWRGSDEADKLKITGQDGWAQYGSVWATNETGFYAKANGCRVFNGLFSYPIGLVYMGFWWTKSEHASDEAWYRYMDYKKSTVFRSHIDKRYGCSVRCVKD